MSSEIGSDQRVLARTIGVTKSFGGLQVLSGIDFELRAGEVHALVGENGAGKSTLVKIIAGLVTPDAGTVEIDGEKVSADRRQSLMRHSRIAMVHQELSVVPDLSVLDNLLLGDQGGLFYRRSRYRAKAREDLDEIGLDHVELNQLAGDLSLAEQQLVEIARSMGRDARVTILDEPTATLSDAEIEKVFQALERLRLRGNAVLYISHRLRDIFAITDRVTTLRNGELVATQTTNSITDDELVSQMLGSIQVKRRQSVEVADHGATSPRQALDASGLVSGTRFQGVNIEVAAGQILGVIGQVGSGAGEVVRALAGLDPYLQGEIEIDGEPMTRYNLGRAQKNDVWFLSESRKRDGLFLDFSVQENLTSPILDQIAHLGVVSGSRRKQRARELARQFAVSTDRLGSRILHLSGGNQQKVAVAKVVSKAPKVLLLSEPTRGVDVGARTEIYEQLWKLSAEGVAIVCFTSDVTEAIELCDDVVTMFRGKPVKRRVVEDGIEAELLADILHGGGAS